MLERLRDLVRQNRQQTEIEAEVQKHIQAQQEQDAAAQEADPRNWSSTRFKKEMPKPRTPQDQAFYDATLADIKAREKGLFDKIMTDLFGRPGAAGREAVRAGMQGENPVQAAKEGFQNPEASETFQNELLRKTNEGLDPKVAQAIGGSLGAAGALLSPEDRETVGRFIAGTPASTLGMIADTVTNPTEWLLAALGAKAIPYISKIPLAGKTVGALAKTKIPGTPDIFPKTPPAVVPAASTEIPAAAREGVRIEAPGTPAVREGAAPPQAPPPAAPQPPAAGNDVAEGLYQKTFNRLQSLENLTKDAKAAGHQVLPGEDPGLRSRGYLGIQPKVQSVLEDKTFRVTPAGKIETTGEGLKPILREFDAALPQVEKAAKERDLVEYLKARRIVARPDEAGSIASPQQMALAKHTLAEIQTRYGEGAQVLEQTATRLYDYQKRVLQSLVDAGNLSEDGYQAILKRNPDYVPFDRVMDEIDFEGVVPRVKQRFSGADAPIKKIVGSEREIHDPIESMIKNTYRVLDSAERNTVARSVAKLADILPGKIQLIDKADPKAIRFYENGEPRYMRASENITEAMKGMTEQGADLVTKILSAPANWLRQGATLTPEFMVRNPIRDQFTAMMQTKVGFNPVVDTTGALADILGKKQVYYDWIRSGGAHSTMTELSRENLKRTLAQLRGNPKLIDKLNILTRAQDISQLFEQATRLGVFKAGQRKGLSPLEAGFQSREATLDFARIGSAMKNPNRIIAFLNANLQGIDKTIRTAKEDPISTAVKGASLITVPSLALYLLNRNDPDYKELPRWQKNLFWMFKAPGTDTFVRIPKPFSYGQVFGSTPEAFLEYLETKDPRAINSLKDSLVQSFSPISGEGDSALWSWAIPTAAKPIIESYFANKSFFTGRDIVPQDKTRLRPSEQTTRNTSEVSKKLGGALNTSPAKLENVIAGYGGGLARYALQLGDKIIDEVNQMTGGAAAPKRPSEVTDIPLVKGFTSRAHITSPESLNEFYDHRKAAETDHLTAKHLYEEGDKAGAEKVLKDGNAEFYKLTQKAGDALSKLSSYEEGLIKSGKYDEAALKKKLAEVDQKRLEIARRVNKVIAAKKRPSAR